MARVFLRGEIYWCEFIRDGTRYRRSMGTSNKRLAEDRAAAFRDDVVNQEFGIRKKTSYPMFGVAMTEFLAASAIRHASHPNTTERLRVASVPLLRTFKAKRLDAITTGDVERYMRSRATSKSLKTKRVVMQSTTNRELACARRMYNHFIETKYEDLKNPFARVTYYPEGEGRMRVLTHDEETRYLNACREPLKSIAIVMLETAMRSGEVVALRKEHLHPTFVEVVGGKTRSARRKIPLTPRARAVLEFRAATAKGPWLFPAKSNPDAHMRKPNNGHVAALKRSGISVPFRVHDLRHTAATRMGESGVDLLTLSSIIGHSRITMTQKYCHPSAQHQRGAIEKLDAYNTAERAKSAINVESPQFRAQKPN